MKIFNHVQVKVKDLRISRGFYDAIMECLGYSVVLIIKDEVIGYGTSVQDMFEIRQSNEKFQLSKFVHVAFNAASKECVDAFTTQHSKKG